MVKLLDSVILKLLLLLLKIFTRINYSSTEIFEVKFGEKSSTAFEEGKMALADYRCRSNLITKNMIWSTNKIPKTSLHREEKT